MFLVKVNCLIISTVGIGCQIIRKLVITRSAKKYTIPQRKQSNMGLFVCFVTYITYIQSLPNILPFGFYPNPRIFMPYLCHFACLLLPKNDINYSLPTAGISLMLLLFLVPVYLPDESFEQFLYYMLFWDTLRFLVFFGSNSIKNTL